ncbi:MAG: hypothetical protein AAFY77_03550 [Pseudomonadota bacterium]
MRRPVTWIVGLLCLVAAALGLRLGLTQSRMDDAALIERAAEAYQRETGGARTDCAAVPGQDAAIRLEVRCGAGTAIRVFTVDHLGQVARVTGDAPET